MTFEILSTKGSDLGDWRGLREHVGRWLSEIDLGQVPCHDRRWLSNHISQRDEGLVASGVYVSTLNVQYGMSDKVWQIGSLDILAQLEA